MESTDREASTLAGDIIHRDGADSLRCDLDIHIRCIRYSFHIEGYAMLTGPVRAI